MFGMIIINTALNRIKDFKNNFATLTLTINSCCDIKYVLAFGVYKITKGTLDDSAIAYCNMVIDGKGWIVIKRKDMQFSEFQHKLKRDLETSTQSCGMN